MTTPSKGPARLIDKWVFWQDKWDTQNGETVQSLIELGEADTARAFWSMFDAHPVDQLPEGSSLHVFKGHVRPEWEDPANIHGGHFRFTQMPDAPGGSSATGATVNGVPTVTTSTANRAWFSLVTGCIGARFTLSSAIVGVGFTNKGATRKVLSLWVNTADQAVIRTLQADSVQHVGEKFTSKFISHKALPRSDFTAQEAVWHRRTKSAPSQYVHIDDDEPAGSENTTSLSSPSTANAADTAGMKRRAVPMPLDHAFADHTAALLEHARSKSEGVARDIVPNLGQLASAVRALPPRSPPPSTLAPSASATHGTHLAAPTSYPGAPVERSETGEFSWQESHMSDLRDSNSGVYPQVKAPTPMKEWADQWSPSLMNAALANRQGGAGGLDAQSSATSPGAGTAESASQHQQQLLAAAAAATPPPSLNNTGTTKESPLSLSRTQPHGTVPPPEATSMAGGAGVTGSAAAPFGSFPSQLHRSPLQTQQEAPLAGGYPQHYMPPQHNQYQQPLVPPAGGGGNGGYYHQQPPHHQHFMPPPPPPPANSHIMHNPYGHMPGAYSMAAGGVSQQHLGHQQQPPLPYVIVRQSAHRAPPGSSGTSAADFRRGSNAADQQQQQQPGRSTAPSTGAAANGGGAGSSAASGRPALFGSAAVGRRESPPPKPATPPPAAPAAPSADRRVQHTKSDAAAFIFKGWMYPPGLNRKERRRIMFSDEVTPAEYPGAKFIGADAPDGPCTDDGVPLPKDDNDDGSK